MDYTLFYCGVLTAFNVLFTVVMVLREHKDAHGQGFNDGFELGVRVGETSRPSVPTNPARQTRARGRLSVV